MFYFVAIFGYAWIFIAGSTILIQNTTDGVSTAAVVIYLTVSLNWLVYGFLTRDKVIVLGSIISIVGNLFVLIAIFVVNNK